LGLFVMTKKIYFTFTRCLSIEKKEFCPKCGNALKVVNIPFWQTIIQNTSLKQKDFK